MRIVDLTYTLENTMLVWPGNLRPRFHWHKRSSSEPANVTVMEMNAHTGTHVDAPLHFLADGETVDRLPLDHFWGKARLFRFREKPRGQAIPLSAALDSGFSLGDAKIFVMDTGIEALAETKDYNLCFPYPSIELLDWLLERGMRTYMTNATGLDLPAPDDPSPVHKHLFRRGVPVVENLRNLGELPEGKDFTICAMPLKLGEREGSPCRAAAMV